jgi:peptidoglycan/LPS O-acetylase OafA/YrhL/lysophospholipase L1-like esterase
MTMVEQRRGARPAGTGAGRPPPAPPRYWPGLDGVRAIAIVAVIVYHLAPGVLPGGFLGVDLFFVVSGYLITTLLVDEWRRRGRVRLLRFWGRRVRRLYPAVLALLAVLIPVMAFCDPGALASSRVTILAALFYLTNWWFVFHHVSYFASFGPPPVLVHLWSLAIEEQYYLIWPPVLVAMLGWWPRPRRVALVALAGAAVSALLMAAIYHGAASVNRVYFGSDTHAEGLLLGSALALSVPPTGFPKAVTARARAVLDWAGVAAVAGLVVLMFAVGQAGGFAWRGGLLLAVVLGGVVVVVAAHPATTCSRALATPLMRWIGTRSYSLYLWHWPVIVMTERGGAVPMAGVPRLLARIVAMVVLSEVSYRYVERPWRTGRAQAALARLVRGSRARRWGGLAGAGAALTGLGLAVALVPAPPAPAYTKVTSTAASRLRLSRRPAGATRPPARATTSPAKRLTIRHRSDPLVTVPPAAADGPVLCLGDSVMLAASADLTSALGPHVTVDAKVGRQVAAGLSRLSQYRAAGRLTGLRALVVGLGSNGPFTPADLTQLRRVTAGVPLVVLVNVRVPDAWQSESDATIASAARLPGFAVVNWYAASADPSLLYPDGVHPDPAGQAVYAHLVEQAVDRGAATRGT